MESDWLLFKVIWCVETSYLSLAFFYFVPLNFISYLPLGRPWNHTCLLFFLLLFLTALSNVMLFTTRTIIQSHPTPCYYILDPRRSYYGPSLMGLAVAAVDCLLWHVRVKTATEIPLWEETSLPPSYRLYRLNCRETRCGVNQVGYRFHSYF